MTTTSRPSAKNADTAVLLDDSSDEPSKGIDKCGLSRAVRTNDPKNITRIDLQIDRREGHNSSEMLGYVFAYQQWFFSHGLSSILRLFHSVAGSTVSAS